MNVDLVAGAVVALIILTYLVAVLAQPERY